MDREPAFNIPPSVLWLSLVLIAVHVIRSFLGVDADNWVLLAFSFIPGRYDLAPSVLPGGAGAWLWSPLTYAFLHGDFMHLTVNLFWLLSFGTPLARRIGGTRFLVLAGVTAVAGAAAHFLAYIGDEAIVVGASGAVSGITAATARFAFAPGGPLSGPVRGAQSYRVPAQTLGQTLRNPRALTFVLIWFAMNLAFGLGGAAVMGVEGSIAWQAHIGGFVAGLLVFPLLDPVQRFPASDHMAR